MLDLMRVGCFVAGMLFLCVNAYGESALSKTEYIAALCKGTMMRAGIVYPHYITYGKLFANGQWVAISDSEYASTAIADDPEWDGALVDIKFGSEDAIYNIGQYLGEYDGGAGRIGGLVAALNDVLDNPGAYNLSTDAANLLLNQAFDAFVLMAPDSRTQVDFSRLDLTGRIMAGLDLTDTGITGDQLANVDDLSHTVLNGLDLSGTDLSEKDLTGASFVATNLSNANLSGQTLAGADFTDANLSSADLTDADLTAAKLSGADMSNSNVTGGQLVSAGNDMSGINLSNTNLSGSNFSNKNMSGANTDGAQLDGTTLPAGEGKPECKKKPDPDPDDETADDEPADPSTPEKKRPEDKGDDDSLVVEFDEEGREIRRMETEAEKAAALQEYEQNLGEWAVQRAIDNGRLFDVSHLMCARGANEILSQYVNGVGMAHSGADAKNMGPRLKDNYGMTVVPDTGNYQNGDTRIIRNTNPSKPGHMETNINGTWYSDFRQNSSLQNANWAGEQTLYRLP